MRCQLCGAQLLSITTNLPFKVGERSIVIVKDLPVMQCEGCREYLLADAVMARVEDLLKNVDASAELEVVRYAA